MTKELFNGMAFEVLVGFIRTMAWLWFPTAGVMYYIGWKKHAQGLREYAILMASLGLIVVAVVWYFSLPSK